MGYMKSAIKMGKMDEARSMLTGGFDVNTVDYDGRAILHVAAAAGDMKLVEMLVKEYDAPVSALDK